jgi:hypothetical protein
MKTLANIDLADAPPASGARAPGKKTIIQIGTDGIATPTSLWRPEPAEHRWSIRRSLALAVALSAAAWAAIYYAVSLAL